MQIVIKQIHLTIDGQVYLFFFVRSEDAVSAQHFLEMKNVLA